MRRQDRAFSTIGSHATTIQTAASRYGRNGSRENSATSEVGGVNGESLSRLQAQLVLRLHNPIIQFKERLLTARPLPQL